MRRILICLILILLVSMTAFASEDTYTVTYVIDGEVVSTQQVAHGKDAVAPEIPGKFGYTQIAPQWDKDGKNITADTTITAEYTINEYVVTYKYEGGTYKSLTYLHGEKVAMVPAPAKEGYNVTWDTVIDTLTADITVNAVYTEIVPEETAPTEEWDNSETEYWTYIILGGTAVLIALFVLLQIQKKKNDRKRGY